MDYEPSLDATPYHPATYREIRAWVLQEYGLKVSSRYVTQVKRKHGIITQGGQSRPLTERVEPIEVPSEIEAAIEAALRHFHFTAKKPLRWFPVVKMTTSDGIRSCKA